MKIKKVYLKTHLLVYEEKTNKKRSIEGMFMHTSNEYFISSTAFKVSVSILICQNS